MLPWYGSSIKSTGMDSSGTEISQSRVVTEASQWKVKRKEEEKTTFVLDRRPQDRRLAGRPDRSGFNTCIYTLCGSVGALKLAYSQSAQRYCMTTNTKEKLQVSYLPRPTRLVLLGC
jgi:hypothetical protein